MSKTTNGFIRWGRLTVIFVLLALAGFSGFLASVTGSQVWLIPQVITWVAALALLLLGGRP